jgi:hypothetical protein
MTLTEFLLARIAEDEAVASRGGRHNAPGVFANDNYGCLLVDPARVLAECEAKRRVVKLHSAESGQHPDFCGHDLRELPCPTLRLLALVYADHPDYLPEWKP